MTATIPDTASLGPANPTQCRPRLPACLRLRVRGWRSLRRKSAASALVSGMIESFYPSSVLQSDDGTTVEMEGGGAGAGAPAAHGGPLAIEGRRGELRVPPSGCRQRRSRRC